MDPNLVINGSNVMYHHNEVVEIYCQRNVGSSAFSIFHGNHKEFSFTNVLLEMSMVLIISHILRVLLKPLKQPKVICDILAGIIIGPSVLGRSKTFADNVSPKSSNFVIENIGILGFVFFLFMTGVKMDLFVVAKAGKKHWVIAIGGMFIAHVIILIFDICVDHYIDDSMVRKPSSVGAISSTMIITTFPSIYSILKEMQILRSEIGRMALTTVIITDFVGLVDIVSFEAMKQSEVRMINAIPYMLSTLLLCALVFYGVPMIMRWIKRQTPKGNPVDQEYIVATLLGVFVVGLLTDFFGATIGVGPLWLGLAIPDRPPVGASIIQQTEVVVNHILMPFAYATVGLKTDVFAMAECWSFTSPVLSLAVMSIVTKLFSVVIMARFVNMSYRDSLTLGFILGLRGQTEFLLYIHWWSLKIVTTSSFSLMVILTIIATSISSLMINYLYDPKRPYMTNMRRTVQHTAQESKLRILACIYDQESMANIFSLLDFTNPTTSNPFKVFAIYFIELVGRAAPMFIDHVKQTNEYWDHNNVAVHKAIKLYEKDRNNRIAMNLFTCVTPSRTMYHDICERALMNKAVFIILPFHKKYIEVGNDLFTEILRPGVQYTNANTLSHAPCSVGVLACKKASAWDIRPTRTINNQNTQRQFVMLFLGGSDAREALMLASRMVEHPDVSLIVIRFLANEQAGDIIPERKMDDGVVTWFWVKNEMNDKVVYKEVVVSNGFETVSAIRSLNASVSKIDLWIVGRKNGINPTFLDGLSDWSENSELGLIGDFLLSANFNVLGCVLVVQQQVLREQHAIPWACY
ncbi:cation/H(+) antiporter 25-like [Chenopodium quinoa]|uniref:cation/H(+) antiporter 25-like n=1 Tax=Chenopodium quinoa TaxID=63459 RepID=UPI000B7744DA|nr:cation/H(+) antiporter 25-like [Chenopodium quinoa]